MDACGKEISGYLRVGSRDVYVTFHEPAARPDGSGLLLLSPFGEERKCAYRTLVRLARAAAAVGLAAARFDYSGTGESTGEHGKAALADWLEEAAAVSRSFRDRFRLEHMAAAGVRLGANLAARLPTFEAVTAMVLIEPLLAGAGYLGELQRRKQIKEMMAGGKARTSAADIRTQWEAGGCVDFDGFDIGPNLAAELAALRLEVDLARLPAACRCLLLRIGALKGFPANWKPVVQQLERRPGNRARILREKPFWGQIEYFETDQVQDAALEFLKVPTTG